MRTPNDAGCVFQQSRIDSQKAREAMCAGGSPHAIYVDKALAFAKRSAVTTTIQ
ncbi:MAG TPA: hypothetical protein VJM09_01275 [Sphingobium sp.]|nr:hypothetical protein [Sphingobium sp.]